MAQSTQAKKNRSVLVFDTEEVVATKLSSYIADLSKQYIGQKGNFTVVLSGQAEAYALRKLVDLYADSVDWSKWWVFWVDEKVVPLDNQYSNYKVTYDDFLSGLVNKIPTNQIYPINYTDSAASVAGDYEQRVVNLAKKGIIASTESGFPKFDFMLLGMGPDGHFASLFADRPQRYNQADWVTFLTDAPEPPPKRITFTFPVINSAANIAVLAIGKSQADTVAQSIGAVNGQQCVYPTAQLQLEANGKLTWFLDKDAASKL
ncbi:hypothetical protein DH2020_009794 [Rehmannia glutinosa]|uniref:Probable 6-phosphogluconolactonase n=1 Tax=Rehmannia glutinosa TaxID=99300 RepID=A0ABR0X8K1_REHGL